MTNGIKILNRSIVMYILCGLVILLIVDQQKVSIKILNHFRNSARYVNRFAIRPDVTFEERKFYEALQYQTRLVKLLPDHVLSYGVLGYAYYHLGQQSKAILAYKRAAQGRMDLFGFHYNLGVLYFLQNDWEQAADAFEKAVNVGPTTSVVHHQQVARRYFKKDSIRKAWMQQKAAELKTAYERSLMLMNLAKRKQPINGEPTFKLYYYVPLMETGVIPLQAIVEGKIQLED